MKDETIFHPWMKDETVFHPWMKDETIFQTWMKDEGVRALKRTLWYSSPTRASPVRAVY